MVVAACQDTDLELVRAARRGDRAAFGSLIERHRPLVLRLCRRLLGSSGLAEDAAQEAVLIAWLNLDSLERPGRFGAWLAGIGLHVARQWLRVRARDAWSLEGLLGGRRLPEPVDWRSSPAERAEEAELTSAVRRALAILPPGQRSAVALFYLAGLTHRETAAALGIQPGAVKTRLHKARAALRRALWATWNEHDEEEHMAAQTAASDRDLVDMHLEDVLRVPVAEPPGERSVLLLAEDQGERVLPIWVGQFEADATAILLVGAQTRRPLTFPFAARLLQAVGGALREVRISRLADETFYAEVVVETSQGVRTVDARPSDAIALALTTGAPIRAAANVLELAGIPPTELEQRRIENTRSAREHADSIRSRLAEAKFTTTALF